LFVFVHLFLLACLYWYCMVYSFYFYFGSFLEYLYSVSNNTIRHCSMWGLALYSHVVNTDIVLIQSYYKVPAPMSKSHVNVRGIEFATSEQSCKCQGYRVCH
jgi:hypothetical protein